MDASGLAPWGNLSEMEKLTADKRHEPYQKWFWAVEDLGFKDAVFQRGQAPKSVAMSPTFLGLYVLPTDVKVLLGTLDNCEDGKTFLKGLVLKASFKLAKELAVATELTESENDSDKKRGKMKTEELKAFAKTIGNLAKACNIHDDE